MPIKPENAKRYPADWKQIRMRILERAADKCETCGLENYAVIRRRQDGTFHTDYSIGATYADAKQIAADLHWELFGDTVPVRGEERIVIVVLTIAHLDHVPEHSEPDNLKALCQRCHLTYDAKHHAANAQITRRAKSPTGQLF